MADGSLYGVHQRCTELEARVEQLEKENRGNRQRILSLVSVVEGLSQRLDSHSH